MYYIPVIYPYQNPYPLPNYINVPMHNYSRHSNYWTPVGVEYANRFGYYRSFNGDVRILLKDYGADPFVVNINEATKQNNTYRTALWTGTHLQVTLMSLNTGEGIGLEMHTNVDQFLRVEKGQGIVQMGMSKDKLNYKKNIFDDTAIMIPAGTWHNVINTGNNPLKLYSIYAPPNHPFGTVHVTKADAVAAEDS